MSSQTVILGALKLNLKFTEHITCTYNFIIYTERITIIAIYIC